jgi:hypothetical protein
MRTKAGLAALLLTSCSGEAAEPVLEACEQDLADTKIGLVAKIRVDGHPRAVLLDTGINGLVVSDQDFLAPPAETHEGEALQQTVLPRTVTLQGCPSEIEVPAISSRKIPDGMLASSNALMNPDVLARGHLVTLKIGEKQLSIQPLERGTESCAAHREDPSHIPVMERYTIRVEDHQGVMHTAILDTGTGVSVFRTELLDPTALKIRSGKLLTLSGIVDADLYGGQKVVLGGKHALEADVLIAEVPFPSDIGGFVGLNMLGACDVAFCGDATWLACEG